MEAYLFQQQNQNTFCYLTLCWFLSHRNLFLCNGLHGHNNHDSQDHLSTDHPHRDNDNNQEYHDQAARYDNLNGLLAADYDHSCGTSPDADGGFGHRRWRQGAIFLQASYDQDWVLQSTGADGRVLAPDKAEHGVQDAMSTWNHR